MGSNNNIQVNFTLKQARQYRDLTMEEVASQLGISKDTYSKYENNPDTISVGLAIKFANDIVKMPFNQLIFS